MESVEIPKDKSLHGRGGRIWGSAWNDYKRPIPKPKMKLFNCPKCGKIKLRVLRDIRKKHLNFYCDNCKFSSSFKVSEKGLYNIREGYYEFADNFFSTPHCSLCRAKISEGVYKYSVKHFGKALCMNHQVKARKELASREGFFCSICKEAISEKVYEYSLEHWSKALCIKHQELEKQKLFCQKCKKPISKTVHDYSVGHFSKPLCLDCQQYHHRMAVKGDNTFEGKGFYCNKCKMTITFPTYRYSMRMYGTPLCKDCQEEQWKTMLLTKIFKINSSSLRL